VALLALVQGVAIWRLAPGSTALAPLLPAILLDALCGALQAVLFRLLLPQRYREPRGFTLLFLWLFCTFVPLAGGLVPLASCAWTACFPAKRGDEDLQQVPAPEFVTYLMSRVSHGGGARLQARLVNTQVNASDRLSALVAIQSMPTRTTGTLLRDLLADPIEDVRLIAYGTLDQAENDVMQKIFQTVQTLDFAQSDSERHTINRQLAELYFELVYQNLVQGAVYTHTLEQADHYARAALEIDDGDAALWLIRGRLALARGLVDDAAGYMARAQALGFPRERLVPWLAEAAYLQRDFARVAELLASLGHASALPMLKPVVRYWSP
jgi:polysaccharide biosynthesis protein PelE